MQMNLTQKLEIAFWDMLIFHLSRYTLVRKLMHYGYTLVENFNTGSFIKVAVVVAMVGFISGFGATMLFSMVF